MLTKFVLYYPHIPRVIDSYLRIEYPNIYNDDCYHPISRVGDKVSNGDIISVYGKNKITSPCDGRITMIGGLPGLHDWPSLRREDNSVSYTDAPKAYENNNINTGSIVFPKQTPLQEAYAFAIEPDNTNHRAYFDVKSSFDYGNVWHGGEQPGFFNSLFRMFKRPPDTIYTTIDLLVYDLKNCGSGRQLPDSLASDSAYKKELLRYWELINNGQAAKEILFEYEVNGPE